MIDTDVNAALDAATDDDELLDAVFDNMELEAERQAELEEKPEAEAKPAPEPEAKPEAEAKPAPEAEAEQEYIDSLEEYAEAHELKVDQLLDLTISLGEDTEPVKLTSLVENHSAVAAERDRLKEEVAQTQNQRAEFNKFFDTLHEKNTVALQILDSMEGTLKDATKDPELLALQQTDKEQYATRMLEIRNHTDTLKTQREELIAGYRDSLDKSRQALVAQESGKLKQLWGDNTQAKFEVAVKTLESLGFQKDELNDMLDSRYFTAAVKLHEQAERIKELEAKQQNGIKAKETAKKMHRGTVKVLRPSGGSPAKAGLRTSNTATFDAKAAKFMKSGGVDEKAFEDAIGALLTGD